MSIVIVNADDYPGWYLEAFDPDGRGGFGYVRWGPDKARAKTFDTLEQAIAEWKRPGTTRPLRVDGKPNRPLTAFSVTFKNSESGETV